jgi:hypothetical protein
VPDRLDYVAITIDRRGEANPVRLPWKSRDYLLRKLRATPVELDTEQKTVLYRLLDDRGFTTGFHQLPEGFFELRNALSDEVAEA